ncbi:RNA-directed DNA polymerase-like protein [Gossypium australe]|uniref:RNA-directed DNA polymerase-like protein n=1 Tax=Gossypium australe TaxID=47621 RepID=A0A5B6UYZ5_9ROSI|nr:RNA-directed DNA polymerase-like protein [Gossypium australe]
MIPVPHIPIKIYLDKYSKPITIIAFIDTGAAEAIMNLDVLPTNWWKPHVRYFYSAADHPFATHLISKPITIQFFRGCCVRTTVLGSKLPGKDIVEGFDLYTKAQHLKILPDGRNEDITPTKASHMGMNLDHLLLAEQECKELQQQDLIEPSNSQWACEAFYVNKISEQVIGKLRLILITNLLMNSSRMTNSHYQLGIYPDDRAKTSFCIPNKHFQWKVMPFGLKLLLHYSKRR